MKPRVPHLCGSISLASAFLAACGASNNPGPSTTAAAVSGPADDHCGAAAPFTFQSVGTCLTNEPPANAAACGLTFAPLTAGGDAGTDDAGAGDDAGAPPSSPYGPTLYNAVGYDDDCKYALSWTATPVKVNTDVTFTLTAKYLTASGPGDPVHCAGVRVEVYADNNIFTPSPANEAPEKGSTGSYDIGPISFTQSGMWTVRFHLFEECGDAPVDSPHGHGAFYVMVP
jgi:hypothetical protein